MDPSPQDREANPSHDYLDRIAARDPRAVADLYDRFATKLYTVILPLVGDSAQAEDLVHDVFVGLHRIVPTFEGRGSFDGWLRKVAVRSALMHLRQQRRKGEIHARMRTASRAYTQQATTEAMDLAEALKRLPVGMRSVFVLKEVGGYSHEEIAKFLGIGVSASKVRLHRARSRLRKSLKGY